MSEIVSVIIPVYKILDQENIKNFSKLIASLADNHLYIKEIIIINDYPEEDPESKITSILKDYHLLGKMAFHRNKRNLGQGATRNKGAKIATGKILHFIDQDDYISKKFYSVLTRKDADFILSGLILINHDGRQYFSSYYKRRTQKMLSSYYRIYQLKKLLFINILFSPGQFIIKKDLFLKLGGYPDLKYRGTDDFGLLLKLVTDKQISFVYVPQESFYYRYHSNQSSYSLDMSKSLKECYQKVFIKDKRDRLFLKWIFFTRVARGPIQSAFVILRWLTFANRIPYYIKRL